MNPATPTPPVPAAQATPSPGPRDSEWHGGWELLLPRRYGRRWSK